MIRAWSGAFGWLGIAVGFAALDLTGVTEGLLLVVPLIGALGLARALDRTPGAGPWGRALAVVAALGSVALAGLVVRFGVGLAALDAPALAAMLLALSLLAIVALIRPVRATLLPRLGLDPDSAVHGVSAIALVLALGLTAVDSVRLQDEAEEVVSLSPADPVISLGSDLALALAAVGFMQTRGLGAALARLGLRRLPARQLGGALLVAAAFHLGVGVLEHAEGVLVPPRPWEDRLRYEFVGVPPLLGAALTSVSVGLGEEVVFRGALQPRLGVILTSVVFAATHVQYPVAGIAMVFVLSLILGFLRRRTSTTFTVCVHTLYDFGAFFL